MTNIGTYGEQLAANYLRNRGYEIITTNWHCPRGEIDIVARKDEMFVFVEVKTRRTQDTSAAFASVTPHKRERLVNSAYLYIDEHAEGQPAWRIDVIGIALTHPPVIEHVEDALGW